MLGNPYLSIYTSVLMCRARSVGPYIYIAGEQNPLWQGHLLPTFHLRKRGKLFFYQGRWSLQSF